MSDPIVDIIQRYNRTQPRADVLAKQIRQQIEAETVQRCIDSVIAIKTDSKAPGYVNGWIHCKQAIIKALEAQK